MLWGRERCQHSAFGSVPWTKATLHAVQPCVGIWERVPGADGGGSFQAPTFEGRPLQGLYSAGSVRICRKDFPQLPVKTIKCPRLPAALLRLETSCHQPKPQSKPSQLVTGRCWDQLVVPSGLGSCQAARLLGLFREQVIKIKECVSLCNVSVCTTRE